MTEFPIRPGAASGSQPWLAVELGDSVTTSICGKFLHELGATVIKLEPPGGSPLRCAPPVLTHADGATLSTLFAYLNAGKKSVTADLGTPPGRELAQALIASAADVILLWGTEKEWSARGLAPSALATLAPQGVVARASMFGDDGPYQAFRGGELQVEALGGLANVIGRPDAEPIRLGGRQAQYAAGLALLTGVSLALYRRVIHGVGSVLATSVLETVSYLEWKSASHYQDDGVFITRGTERGPMILPCADGYFGFYYRAKDWPAILQIFDDPRLRADRFRTQKSRDANRASLIGILTEHTSRWRKRDLYHQAQQRGVAMGYTATMGDLLKSEQYAAREFLRHLDLGEFGTGTVPGTPWRAGPAAVGRRDRVPSAGEHDAEVRALVGRAGE
jgi:crotonobetainyl-CoA:carnitine CoA-transferase CaiB-like acyl-CoA transferase